MKTGRSKRNATFPGGVATTYSTPQYSGTAIETPPVKCETDSSTLDAVDMANKTMPAVLPSSAAERQNGQTENGGHVMKPERGSYLTNDNGIPPKSPSALDTSIRSIGKLNLKEENEKLKYFLQ